MSKINIEHKNICDKYGLYYKNEYTWGNYVRLANKYKISLEEFFIIKNKENIEKNKKLKELKHLPGNGNSIKICVECGCKFAGEKATRYCPNCNKNHLKIQEERNKKINNYNDFFKKITFNKHFISVNEFKNLRNDYLNKPGIIFIWGYNSNGEFKCLTGGETCNLWRHILEFVRKSNKDLVKEDLNDNRWWYIANYYHNFNIDIIKDINNINDKSFRIKLESLYVNKNNAIYWKPTKSQKI